MNTIRFINRTAAALRRAFGADSFKYDPEAGEFFREEARNARYHVTACDDYRADLCAEGIIEQLDTNLYRLTAAYLTGV